MRPNGASGGFWRGFTGLPWACCASRLNRSRRLSSCAGCCAGSMSRPDRRCWESAVLWKSCSSCRDLKFRRMLGSGRFWRRRVADYDPKWLDQLCLTGAVGWGRLSPHPATLESAGAAGSGDGAPRQRRVIPTSVAPITFFVREDADWMALRQNPHPVAENATRVGHPSDHGRGLSHGAALVLDFLRQRGASFFADIVRGTGKLKAEIETALWELVAAGLVTADGFDNLRSLIDPKRRAGQGSGRSTRPRHSAGRWAVLHADVAVERPRAVEAACWMLLRRYGIVIRDLLAREANLPTVAGIVDGFPAAGGSRRNSRRTVCRWISGRAVCVAGGSGVGAGDAEPAVEWGDDHALGGGSVESGWDSGAGGASAGDLG